MRWKNILIFKWKQDTNDTLNTIYCVSKFKLFLVMKHQMDIVSSYESLSPLKLYILFTVFLLFALLAFRNTCFTCHWVASFYDGTHGVCSQAHAWTPCSLVKRVQCCSLYCLVNRSLNEWVSSPVFRVNSISWLLVLSDLQWQTLPPNSSAASSLRGSLSCGLKVVLKLFSRG